MSRRVGLLVGALALIVVTSVVVTAAVVVAPTVGRWLDDDRWVDRGGLVADPTPAQLESALRFAALAPAPPGSRVGPVRAEQGIDGLVVLRVRMAPDQVAPWLAASRMPSPAPSPTTVPLTLGPDLPAGTPVVPQHRAGRPGGGVVNRDGALVAAGVVEIRAFET